MLPTAGVKVERSVRIQFLGIADMNLRTVPLCGDNGIARDILPGIID